MLVISLECALASLSFGWLYHCYCYCCYYYFCCFPLVRAELKRYLDYDQVVPSFGNTITCTALKVSHSSFFRFYHALLQSILRLFFCMLPVDSASDVLSCLNFLLLSSFFICSDSVFLWIL